MGLTCPRCAAPLDNLNQGQVLRCACSSCGGHAVTLSAMRRETHGDAISVLWKLAQQQKVGKGPGCPTCMNAMTVITLTVMLAQMKMHSLSVTDRARRVDIAADVADRELRLSAPRPPRRAA